MRISDWSSERVLFRSTGKLASASSEHPWRKLQVITQDRASHAGHMRQLCKSSGTDRKSVVSGKSVSVRVDLGGRRIIKKTTQHIQAITPAHTEDAMKPQWYYTSQTISNLTIQNT